MKFVYEFDDRPEAPVFSPPIRHIVREREPDATLCDAYIDTTWSRDDARLGTYPSEFCAVCQSMAYHAVMDAARRQVAQELGVDESEVF